MAKRGTQIEVTKIFGNGEEIVTLNKNKMNAKLCKQVVERLTKDWENLKDDKNSDITDIKFKCVG
jgi:hypothetical protein